MNRIERVLISKLKPTFLAMNYDNTEANPFIHIVISAKRFNKLTIDERITTVFKCLHDEDVGLVEKNILVVEAFNSKEMVDVFEHFRG